MMVSVILLVCLVKRVSVLVGVMMLLLKKCLWVWLVKVIWYFGFWMSLLCIIRLLKLLKLLFELVWVMLLVNLILRFYFELYLKILKLFGSLWLKV